MTRMSGTPHRAPVKPGISVLSVRRGQQSLHVGSSPELDGIVSCCRALILRTGWTSYLMPTVFLREARHSFAAFEKFTSLGREHPQQFTCLKCMSMEHRLAECSDGLRCAVSSSHVGVACSSSTFAGPVCVPGKRFPQVVSPILPADHSGRRSCG